MALIPEYAGDIPNLTQTQPAFDQNNQDWLDYFLTLAPSLNESASELNNFSTTATSVTSNTITTLGNKTFTVEAGKSFQVGMSIRAAFDSTNYMNTEVVSYSGTTLVLNNKSFKGTGTRTAWVIFGSQDSVVGTAQIEDDAITTAKILNSNVTTAKIADSNVTLAKLENAAKTNRIEPITASVSANALTITINPTTLDFRSATLTSGAVLTANIASAISTVISNGSTAGFTSGVKGTIAVAAIYNGGTPEVAWTNLAGGQALDETGIISTTAEGGAGGADSATVWYSTTARSNQPYRIVGYLELTEATAGTWATAPSLIQGAGGNKVINSTSMIRLNTANGYGSTNTVIRRFTNTVVSQGTDITYADSATLGGTFTINTSGNYSINYSDGASVATDIGITLNSNQLTTSIVSVTVSTKLIQSTSSTASGATAVAWTGFLNAGDVIRAHTVGNGGGTADRALFTIAKI